MGDIIVALFIIIILENVSATDFNRSFTKEDRQLRGEHTQKEVLNVTCQQGNAFPGKPQQGTISQLQPFHVTKIEKTGNTTLNTCKDVERLELSYVAGEDIIWYNHFGKLAVPQKVNSNSTPMYSLNRKKTLSAKALYKHFYSCFIYKSQNIRYNPTVHQQESG